MILIKCNERMLSQSRSRSLALPGPWPPCCSSVLLVCLLITSLKSHLVSSCFSALPDRFLTRPHILDLLTVCAVFFFLILRGVSSLHISAQMWTFQGPSLDVSPETEPSPLEVPSYPAFSFFSEFFHCLKYFLLFVYFLLTALSYKFHKISDSVCSFFSETI